MVRVICKLCLQGEDLPESTGKTQNREEESEPRVRAPPSIQPVAESPSDADRNGQSESCSCDSCELFGLSGIQVGQGAACIGSESQRQRLFSADFKAVTISSHWASLKIAGRKAASYWDGGKYTPSFKAFRWNCPKRPMSHSFT